ncbi:MAG: hypothetical protein PQJ59_08995 [Spirochaetales bacterium]|nr:hypothetical protein [Spirochaetales bacterium]
MSSSKYLLLLFMLIFFSLKLTANPFIKPQDQNQPAPVRPPSYSAPSSIIEGQYRFREAIAAHLSDWKENRGPRSFFSLALAGFIYGILHALGPGHRKTVIFSLFITREARFYEPIAGGFLSALLHGLSAAVVILSFRSLSNRLFLDKVNVTSLYLEGITYLLLALLAIGLLLYELLHHHNNNENKTNRSLYGTIALTSAFPCPAAVMILVFSLSMDLLPLGIITVGALSLGMGITISAIGFLAWSGRTGLMGRLKNKEKLLFRISHLFEAAGYLFLILFSLWMALPFLVSLPELL